MPSQYVLYQGTFAALSSLPSTGKAGVLAYTTDTKDVYVDTGSGSGIPGAWKLVGGAGSSGVTQIVAGTNVTISPVGGTGAVTVNASGGGGGGGNVVGPGSAVDNDFAQFDGTSGKLVKDTGLSVTTDGTLAANSDSLIATEKAVKTYVDSSVTAPSGTGNKVYATPNGFTGAALLRSLVEADLPPSSQVGLFGITIDGGGSTPSTGIKGFITIPYGCTITSWTIIADQSGSASVDVWFLAGSAPPVAPSIPTSGNKISSSAPIVLSTAQSAAGGATAISTWTRPLTQWGTLAFNLASVTTCQRIAIQVQVQRA